MAKKRMAIGRRLSLWPTGCMPSLSVTYSTAAAAVVACSAIYIYVVHFNFTFTHPYLAQWRSFLRESH